MSPWVLINFAVFVGLLWYFLRRPAADFWKKRSETVADSLKQSAESFRAARIRMQEMEKRLEHIEGEIDALKIRLEEEGGAEKAQIVSQARLEAERIREEAVEIGRQEVKRAREQLRREMVESAMSLARTELDKRLGNAEQRRLLQASVEHLERKLH